MQNFLIRISTHPFTERLAQNPISAYLGLVLFFTSFFMIGFLIQTSFLLIQVPLFIVTAVFYFIFLVKADEKDIPMLRILFYWTVVIGALTLTNSLIYFGIERVESSSLRSSMLKFLLLVNAAIIIGSFGFWRQENVKAFLDELSTAFALYITGKDVEIKLGDAILGEDIDSGKKVVLPLTDRYLHMLILGPTGSGKTSQTILPMIHRDIQNENLGIIAIEPKGDLAEKIWAMAEKYNRNVKYFNPIHPSCPYFNPLYGDESDVVENMATTFKMLAPDSSTYFANMAETLIRRGMVLLKRLYGNDATLLHFDTLINNYGGQGEVMVNQFTKLPTSNPSISQENIDIAQWFLNDYYTGAKGLKTATKTYEHSSGLRSQVAKLTSNKYLRKVLNPPPGEGSGIDFDAALANGDIITIGTAQGKLRDLGRFLGYFLILQLQACVFRRPGDEDTRVGCMLYIDEFQVYANPGFEDLLTQGRSYRVASHLATQTRDLIGRGGTAGREFLGVVSTNCRNVVVYPGGSVEDDEYYSKFFGTIETVTTQTGKSRKRFSLLSPMGTSQGVTISEREVVEEKSRFTATAIHTRPFGQITYALIKENNVGVPGVAKISFIPNDLNQEIKRMVAEYNELIIEEEAKAHRANPADIEHRPEDEPILDFTSNDEEESTPLVLEEDYVEKDEQDQIKMSSSRKPSDTKPKPLTIADDEDEDEILI